MNTTASSVIASLCAGILIGCSPTLTPVKGSYVDGPFQISTAKSKEEVWNRILDLIAARGIGIKTIDKGSGLIISNRMSFLDSFTYENRDTTLVNPEAFVVCVKRAWGSMQANPVEVSGEWYIHVVESEGGTLIAVNLANFEVGYPGESPDVGRGRSTGKFERVISDSMK